MSVAIRAVAEEDEAEFIAAARRSTALHGQWVTAPTTSDAFRTYLSRFDLSTNFGFVVLTDRSKQIAGAVHLTNIVRGTFQSGYLGYYAFAGAERRGHMKEGLRAVVRHAFGTLKLHRLEANIQPENVASIALVRACGFKQEGYSPKYLKIAGRWRDHERWAIFRG